MKPKPRNSSLPPLSGPDRKRLEDSRARLVKAQKSLGAGDDRLTALQDKQESVAQEVSRLQDADALDDLAVEKLSAKERQQTLIEKALGEAESEVSSREKEYFDAGDFAGRTLSGTLAVYQDSVCEFVGKQFAPFYTTPERAHAAASQCDAVGMIAARRGFLQLRPSQRGVCQRFLGWIELTLKGDMSWLSPDAQ